MAENDSVTGTEGADHPDYRRFAGTAVFPRSTTDLTSAALCPACLTILSGPHCGNCQLDLGHPAAVELGRVSAQTAALLERRLELIGRIRHDGRAALAASRDAANAVVRPISTAGPSTAPTTSVWFPLPAAAPVEPPTPTPATAPAPRGVDESGPRRSSVQVILLIVGISLLAVAAIFFVVYAFINYGVLGRSVIIGTVTVASVVIASMLRRRSLTATAEGVAALAVVLVYLDVFAIRANDFLSLGAADAGLYWGVALLVTAALFLAWHRLSGLRTPRIVGFAAIVPAVGLLAAGADPRADGGSRTYVAFAAAALAGAVHHFASRRATATRVALVGRPERTIVRALAGVALAGSFVGAAFVGGGLSAGTGMRGTAPDAAWTSVPAYLGVAALAGLHAWLVGRASAAPANRLAAFFAALSGVAAAGAAAVAAVRLGDPNVIVIAPPIAAVLVALALELGWRRLRLKTRGESAASTVRGVRTAGIAAGAVLGMTLLLPGATALTATATAVSRGVLSTWQLAPFDVLANPSWSVGLSMLALAVVAVLAAAGFVIGGTLRKRVALLSWFAATVLILAAPLLATLTATVGGWLLLSVAALVAMLVLDRGRHAARLRAPLAVLCGVSGVLGYLIGWGGMSTWWIASVVVVAVLLASRLLPASPLGRATSLGTAAVVFLIASGASARQFALPRLPSAELDFDNVARAVGLAAIVLVSTSAFPATLRLSVLDRRVLFGLGIVTVGVSFATVSASVASLPAAARMSLLLPEFATSLAASAALMAVLLLWLTRPPSPASRFERTIASLCVAPTLAVLLDAFARVLALPEFARSVAPASAALLAAVGVLVVTVLRPDRAAATLGDPPAHAARPRLASWATARWTRELGILLLSALALVGAVVRHDAATWLVFVLTALTALVLATGAHGLFGSRSLRRHLGWLSLALATAGLWWRLGDSRVTAIEPYVLPLAGVLLLVSVFVWRAAASVRDSAPGRVAPLIALTGLLVAIVPLGIAGATDGPARPLIVGGISATLAIAGGSVVVPGHLRPFLDSAALAGAIGVVLVTAGRAIALLAWRGPPDLRLDSWLVSGAVVLAACAALQSRPGWGAGVAGRGVAGQALGVAALALLLFEIPSFVGGALAPTRALGTILCFSALHVLAFAVDRPPLGRLLGWVAVAFAGAATAAAILTGALPQVEFGTVPMAFALIASGGVTLAKAPTARTWAWLAPGVGTLLVPSLLASAADPAPWRLVALGVVGVAIVIASAMLRLQAPFLIAVVVVVIHAIATFAPQIRAIYQSVEWWLWFVPVGIIVVVFAARFERSVLTVRSVAMRIRALR